MKDNQNRILQTIDGETLPKLDWDPSRKYTFIDTDDENDDSFDDKEDKDDEEEVKPWKNWYIKS